MECPRIAEHEATIFPSNFDPRRATLFLLDGKMILGVPLSRREASGPRTGAQVIKALHEDDAVRHSLMIGA